MFYCQVDTNNITESFNNVLRRRYLPLRHDTTIFALVQILIEVAFKEQETKYNQSIIQQSQAYRKPRYHIPSYLEGRPHKVQSHIMLNMERAKAIPKSHITESDTGVYDIVSNDGKSWRTVIPCGTCTCPSFVSTNIPCKHFFAVFYHHTMWNWKDLPSSLTEASHMVLDNINESTTSTNMDLDMPSRLDTSMSYGQELPKPKPTTATQIYKIQKQIEDSVARCRTLAYLTSDITVLEEALVHCQAACNTLATAATTKQDHGPPIVTAIENAGVEEFKGKAKLSHRVGMKHRVHRRRESLNYSQDPLLKRPSTTVGRPKNKRPQRKLRPSLDKLHAPTEQKF